MIVELSDCGQELDSDRLYAEGRSSLAAREWIEAVRSGDQSKAIELTTPELGEFLEGQCGGYDPWPYLATWLPFTWNETLGVVNVETVGVDTEHVIVANPDDIHDDGDYMQFRAVVLLLDHSDGRWLVDTVTDCG